MKQDDYVRVDMRTLWKQTYFFEVAGKAMRSANAYASYAKTTEFRGIPRFGITVFNENNSVTLTLT